MKKNTGKIVAIVLICVAVLSIFGVGCYSDYIAPDDVDIESVTLGAKNVIMMIGDGMGATHIEVTKKYFNIDKLSMETVATATGTVATRSRWNFVTDSAAAATALSCGKKTVNGTVGKLYGKNLETMAEYAKSKGMGVGVIATETLKGATPAGFSVHADNRGDEDAITKAQISSSFDLFIGSGTDYYADYSADMTRNNIDYLTSCESFETKTQNYLSNTVAFSRTWVAIDGLAEAGNYGLLSQAVSLAVDYLSARYAEEGFFLMIEESHIDKCNHNNTLVPMMQHLLALDNTWKTVTDWAKTNGETYVFLTADHESGNLQWDGRSELNDSLYYSDGHTGKDVRFFVYTPSVFPFDGKKIDNTDIAKLNRKIIANAR